MDLFVTLLLVGVVGWITSYFAQQRGRDPLGWFLIGVLLGIIGLIILFVLPDLTKQETTEKKASPSPAPKDGAWLKDWFYLDESRSQQGPISFEKLKKLWDEKTIDQKTYLWCEGMENWKRIEELPTLPKQIQEPAFR